MEPTGQFPQYQGNLTNDDQNRQTEEIKGWISSILDHPITKIVGAIGVTLLVGWGTKKVVDGVGSYMNQVPNTLNQVPSTINNGEMIDKTKDLLAKTESKFKDLNKLALQPTIPDLGELKFPDIINGQNPSHITGLSNISLSNNVMIEEPGLFNFAMRSAKGVANYLSDPIKVLTDLYDFVFKATTSADQHRELIRKAESEFILAIHGGESWYINDQKRILEIALTKGSQASSILTDLIVKAAQVVYNIQLSLVNSQLSPLNDVVQAIKNALTALLDMIKEGKISRNALNNEIEIITKRIADWAKTNGTYNIG